MATAQRPDIKNFVPSTLQTPSTPQTHSSHAAFSSDLNAEVAEHVVTPVAVDTANKAHYVSPLDEPLPMSMPLRSDVKDAGYLGGEKTLQIIEDGRLACSKCDSADFRVLENIMLGEETQLRQYYSREWAMGCLPTGKSRLTVTDKRIIQEDLWGIATWMPTTCLFNRLSSAPHREIKFVLVQKAERKKAFYAFLLVAYLILGLIIGVASGDYAIGFLVSIPIIGIVGPIVAGNCCMDWMVLLGVNQAGYGIFGLTGIKKSEAENVRAILHQAVEAESV